MRTRGNNPQVPYIQRNICSIKTTSNQSCWRNLHPRHPQLHHWIYNKHNQIYHGVSIPNLWIGKPIATYHQWPELQITIWGIYRPGDILQRPWRLPPYGRSDKKILLQRPNPDNRDTSNLEIPTIPLSHAIIAPPWWTTPHMGGVQYHPSCRTKKWTRHRLCPNISICQQYQREPWNSWGTKISCPRYSCRPASIRKPSRGYGRLNHAQPKPGTKFSASTDATTTSAHTIPNTQHECAMAYTCCAYNPTNRSRSRRTHSFAYYKYHPERKTETSRYPFLA